MQRSIALQQLTLEIASLAPLQQVLHRICETVRLLLHTDIGYIALYNEKSKRSPSAHHREPALI